MTSTGKSGALRMKAQTDSHSKGWKDFICREFREEKDCILGNAGGPGNQ
jgi:hypothetical protein